MGRGIFLGIGLGLWHCRLWGHLFNFIHDCLRVLVCLNVSNMSSNVVLFVVCGQVFTTLVIGAFL